MAPGPPTDVEFVSGPPDKSILDIHYDHHQYQQGSLMDGLSPTSGKGVPG